MSNLSSDRQPGAANTVSSSPSVVLDSDCIEEDAKYTSEFTFESVVQIIGGGFPAIQLVSPPDNFADGDCSFGYINAFGVFENYYRTVMIPEYSDSAVAWIGSLQGEHPR